MATDIRHFATQTYNGWANYETWNVALWINNDEGLYNIAQESGSWDAFQEFMIDVLGINQTPDGVLYNDPELNQRELSAMFNDL